jgi:hypothetical protein
MVDRRSKISPSNADNPDPLKTSSMQAFSMLDLNSDNCIRKVEYRESIAKVKQEAERLAN